MTGVLLQVSIVGVYDHQSIFPSSNSPYFLFPHTRASVGLFKCHITLSSVIHSMETVSYTHLTLPTILLV